MGDPKPPEREAAELEDRALRFLRSVPPPRGLTSAAVARIGASVISVPARGRRRTWAWALVTLILACAGSAWAWKVGAFRRAMPAASPTTSETPPPPRRAIVSHAPMAPPVASNGQVREEVVAPLPVVVRRPASKSLPRAERLAPAAETPPAAPLPQESAIVQEAASLATIRTGWRRDHDGRAALARLTTHDQRFASGQMTVESRLLRLEILLAERRESEALAVMDGLPLGRVPLPRERELRTVRGELRVAAGRCREAEADLRDVAAESDGLGARARAALTHCPGEGKP